MSEGRLLSLPCHPTLRGWASDLRGPRGLNLNLQVATLDGILDSALTTSIATGLLHKPGLCLDHHTPSTLVGRVDNERTLAIPTAFLPALEQETTAFTLGFELDQEVSVSSPRTDQTQTFSLPSLNFHHAGSLQHPFQGQSGRRGERKTYLNCSWPS